MGEPRLGGSPKSISDLLAASPGALINKAQRAERLYRTQEVGGSNPLVSTIFFNVAMIEANPITERILAKE